MGSTLKHTHLGWSVRSRLVGTAFIFVAAATSANANSQGLTVAGIPQLLMDDYVIESSSNIKVVQLKPVNGRVVLKNDAPWEQRVFYPDVIRLPNGTFRMFYNAGLVSDPRKNVISVADSRDGFTFVKPKLGFFDQAGVRTNIVYNGGHGPGVELDPSDRSGRTFRMGFADSAVTMGVASSDQQLRFRAYPGNPVLRNKADTKQSIVWDPSIKKWVWFSRFWENPQDGRPGWTSGFKGQIRSVGRSESSDFVTWSQPRVVIRRSMVDPALSDFYGLQVTVRHGLMIGLLWDSDWYDTQGRVGRQRAELVVSRDSGLSWTRVSTDDPYFDLGPAGSFDSEIVWPSEIVSAGDQDLIYYLGANVGHGMNKITEFPKDKYRIGVRAVPRDRFAGRVAGSAQGSLVTKPIKLPRNADLYINADISRGGHIKVQMLDESGKALSTMSSPVTGNQLNAGVRWAKSDLRRLGGKTVRLSFQMRQAALYTFTVK